MADTNTDVLGLLLQETGNNNNTWGALLNTQVIQYIEDKLVGRTSIVSTGGTYTATQAELRANFLVVTGTLASNLIIEVLNKKNSWWVQNSTTGSFTLTFKTSGGSASAVIPQGAHALVFCDGSNVCTVGLASTVLSAQVAGADGSAAAPTWTFANDLDCGRWRTGTNAFADGVNGAAVVTYSTTGISITGTITASLGLTVTAGGLTVTAGGLTVTAGSISVPALSIAGAALADGAITTAKITDAQVTYAKFQSVTQAKFLGRYTASTGVVQECSFGSDFAFNSSTGEVSLAVAPAEVVLSTQTLGIAASSIEFGAGSGNGTIDSTYREYEFQFHDIVASSGTPNFIMEVSTDGGSTWLGTTSYQYAYAGPNTSGGATAGNGSTGAATFLLGAIASTSGQGAGGKLSIFNVSSAASYKIIVFTMFNAAGSANIGGGRVVNIAAINAIRFRPSSGNFAIGSSIVMRGKK